MTLYITGKNEANAYGTDEFFPKLTVIDNLKDITSIHSNFDHTIYSNHDNTIQIVTGSNEFGQLGLSSQSQSLPQFAEISYFNNNNIKIKKICRHFGGRHRFWISQDDDLYVCGKNDQGQLGLYDKTNRFEPIFARSGVIDCASAARASFCLRIANKEPFYIEYELTIIHCWCRLYLVPIDIIPIIISYCKRIKVSVTHNTKWNELKKLRNKNIMQLSCGAEHSLLLSMNGNVYGSGYNKYGQLGIGAMKGNQNISDKVVIGENKSSKKEFIGFCELDYFVDINVKIKYVTCGLKHNLVIDMNDKCWSWGHNNMGQCGLGSNDKTNEIVYKPKMIKDLEQFIVEYVECGFDHSYCRIKKGLHYLFGGNQYQQCIINDIEIVKKPFCINDKVKEQTGYDKIFWVSLGNRNTKLILE